MIVFILYVFVCLNTAFEEDSLLMISNKDIPQVLSSSAFCFVLINDAEYFIVNYSQ